MRKNLILIGFSLIVVTGCTSSPKKYTNDGRYKIYELEKKQEISLAEQEAENNRIAKLKKKIKETIPICKYGKDCDIKWEMTQIWVNKNSGMKIQTATSALIDTYNPLNEYANGATVVKEAIGNDKYQIILEIKCKNPYDNTACTIMKDYNILSFNNYINSKNKKIINLK